MMTYDNADVIISMAKKRNFQIKMIPMKNRHHDKRLELLITPD